MNLAAIKSLPQRPWFVGALLAVPAFVGGFTYPGSATRAQVPVVVMTKAELAKHDAEIRIEAAREVLSAQEPKQCTWRDTFIQQQPIKRKS